MSDLIVPSGALGEDPAVGLVPGGEDAEVRHIHTADAGTFGDAQDSVPAEDGAVAENTGPDFVTAFVVVIQADGNCIAMPDVNQLNGKRMARQATWIDMKAAAHQIIDDINRETIAERMASMVPEALAMMAQRSQAAQIATQVSKTRN